MHRSSRIFFLRFWVIVLIFMISSIHAPQAVARNETITSIHVGLISDLATMAGKMSLASISLAIGDFYAERSNYTTRIILHPRDSKGDIMGAASAAMDLLKNIQVQAIIGPTTSTQANFVAALGSMTHVPILSFSAGSPSLYLTRSPYFVRTTANEASQVGAVAAVIKHFGWRDVVPIYEDTEYGSMLITALIDAFLSVDARIPYRSAIPSSPSNDRITAELYKLKTMQTRVFVVHTNPSLCSRLFTVAAAIGMMSKGYVWIVTYGSALESLEPAAIHAMQGVLLVRPYVVESNQLTGFRAHFNARFQKDNPSIKPLEPTIFDMWAYNTAWALAFAVEKAGITGPSFRHQQSSDNSTDLATLGVSETGEELLSAILNTEFDGITGRFQLVEGQLQPPAFQIVNVIGGEGRGIGFWTPETGLFREWNSPSPSAPSVLLWPGESAVVPNGWEIPTDGKKLRIGVPLNNNEFVKVELDPITNTTTFSGYCIEMFVLVTQALPYAVPYEFVSYSIPQSNISESYTELVYQVYLEKLDAVVGDVTITANRFKYADFTMPFMESGVSMVVVRKGKTNTKALFFLKPLTIDLWLGSITFFLFTGFVVWMIEHRINDAFRGPFSKQLGLVLYFMFSTIVFAHKEKLESNLSRLVVIVWVFVVLILTSSYTASLTSMLTVQQLQPAINSGDFIGFHAGSYVVGLLEEMNFDKSKLVALRYPDEYTDALDKGSQNGGVDAIFDETPYLKLLLSKLPDRYMMVGQSYKTDVFGFGFAFPKRSPLVHDISAAILNMSHAQTEKLKRLERAYFGDPSNFTAQDDAFARFNFRNFWGLFLITGTVSLLSLFVFLGDFIYKERKEVDTVTANVNSLRGRLMAWAKHYDCNSNTSKRENVSNFGGHEKERGGMVMQSPISVSSYSDVNSGPPEDELRSASISIPTTDENLMEISEVQPVFE